MEQAKNTYNRLINTIKKVNDAEFAESKSKQLNDLIAKIENAENKIIDAMEDDFDTPVALAELLTLFREINKAILQDGLKINKKFKDRFFKFIEFNENIFGIFPSLNAKMTPFSFESMDEKDKLIKSLVNLIIEIRAKLRDKKLYDLSDVIRERLRELGIDIEDKKL
jgi:cysteinyl-tRNA synthetase